MIIIIPFFMIDCTDDMVRPIMTDFKKALTLFIFIFMMPASSLYAQNISTIETESVTVLFDKSLEFAAQEVLNIYPAIKQELETNLFWIVDFRPSIVLVGNRDYFRQMSGNSSYVAYAVPGKNLIVVDYSRMNTHPFTLRATIKHELCHLLLHRHITEVHLPRWIDEGVAQWVSGGMAEIVTNREGSIRRWTALTGGFIRLDALSYHFPQNEHDLILAYDQSKEIVEYIIATYGKNGILNILAAMKSGIDADKAISMSLMLSVDELEQQWLKEQRSWNRTFSYLAANIYTVIFILSALMTAGMYLRAVIRKKRYRDQESDEHVFEAYIQKEDDHRREP